MMDSERFVQMQFWLLLLGTVGQYTSWNKRAVALPTSITRKYLSFGKAEGFANVSSVASNVQMMEAYESEVLYFMCLVSHVPIFATWVNHKHSDITIS